MSQGKEHMLEGRKEGEAGRVHVGDTIFIKTWLVNPPPSAFSVIALIENFSTPLCILSVSFKPFPVDGQKKKFSKQLLKWLNLSCFAFEEAYLITCCALCYLNRGSNRADINRSAIFELKPLLKMSLAQISFTTKIAPPM